LIRGVLLNSDRGLMKVYRFSIVIFVAIFDSVYSSEQPNTMPVYPANVPAPTIEQARRQPSARTKEYKQAYKTERLKNSPLIWKDSWLQRQWQNIWRKVTFAPTARAIDYEKAYTAKPPQPVHRNAAIFWAYEAAVRNDKDVAARENAKAYATAQQLRSKIQSIEGKMKVNRRKRKKMDSGTENTTLRKKFDDQYRKMLMEKTILEKAKDEKFYEARHWYHEYMSKSLEQYNILISGKQ
jgi:hypothetical protein